MKKYESKYAVDNLWRVVKKSLIIVINYQGEQQDESTSFFSLQLE